ncbi:hypothetical protein OsI_18567 [Oryza sativa Indica Group]|uniref:Uncharacterized protein n=1 Tax=Oryza sativa subsp. indica TaxID=39946 RepID=A2Y0P3_ORYSI|nr:hypothetical protein OsI_18567 [Oryza sativa Indica Group]
MARSILPSTNLLQALLTANRGVPPLCRHFVEHLTRMRPLGRSATSRSQQAIAPALRRRCPLYQSPKSPSVITSRIKNFSRRSASNGQPPAARSPNREKGASRELHARPLRPPERLTRSKGGVRGGVEAEAEAEAEAASLLRREDGGVGGGAGARW